MAVANAEYVINIAADMPDGEITIAQLDELTAGLLASGKNADHFQQAIQQASNALASATEVSKAANEALKAGEAEYGLLEKSALEAAKAQEKAARLGVVPPAVAKQADDAAQAVAAYAEKLKLLEADAKGAAKQEEVLSTQLTNVRKLSAHADKTIASQAESIEKLRGGLASVPGPLGKLGSALLAPVQGFAKLSSTMGSSQAAALLAATGIGALVVAVVALSAALVVGIVKIAAWGVELADSARSAGLAQDALEALNPSFVSVRNVMGDLTKETGIQAKELNTLSKSLLAAGVSSEKLPAALEAAALAEAALGQGGSAEFIAQIKEGKLAVDDFARDTKAKFGGIVAKQMKGLDAQTQRFHDNLGKTFGGLNIEPVLNGLEKLVGLFDESSTSGQTLKFLFESIFQPLIDQAETAATVVEAFAIGFEIGLVKLYIALKPTIKAVEKFFGFDDTALTDLLSDATSLGEAMAYVFAGLAVVFGTVAAAIAVVVGLFVGAVAAIGGLVAAAISAQQAVINFGESLGNTVREMVSSAIDFIGSIDFVGIGKNIIQGLINGITGAAGALKDAVTAAVDGAIRAAKQTLGIASPSKVFAGIGAFTSEGFAKGVDDNADTAQTAMADMVSPVDVASPLSKQDALSGNFGGSAPAVAAPSGGGAAGGGGAASVNFAGATFNFYGVEGAEDAERRFAELLTKTLEGDAASLGTERAA